ncbi:hypothetical protein MKW92_016941 [Papaver armeniacum]|nr:hypothetical protein MKW92_016941 [Papaver armeniacum]
MDNSKYTYFSVISATLVIIFSLYIINILFRSKNNDKMPKKKRYHPIAGTTINQILNFNTIYHYMTDLATKYKTFRFVNPFQSQIYTSDPANVEYILKTNFQNYGKGSYNYNNLKDLLGDGIFAVDGDKWRHQRKISSYEFSTRVLRDFSSVVFQKNAAKTARVISDNASSNLSMDIQVSESILKFKYFHGIKNSSKVCTCQDLFMKSTLDSIFQVAFGIELDSMCGSSEEGALFANAFDDSSAATSWRYIDISWPIKRFLNIGSESTLKKNIKVIDGFVYKLIHTKIELNSNSPNDSSVSY